MKKLLLTIVMMLAAGAAQARLEVTVTGGMEGALPIAVVPFGWDQPMAPPHDVSAIVASDLARSGRFAPLKPDQLPQRPHSADEVDYSRWGTGTTESLVVGRMKVRPGGGYTIEFQLIDLVRRQQVAGYSIPATAAQLRRAAHQISDIVYEKLTGERGAFDTHIAYVTVQGALDNRQYQLAVADSDGHNEQVILRSAESLMSPSWAPDGERLAYVSFEGGRSMVFVQEIATGKRRKIAEYPGLNSAPAWSPDGARLALTLSRDGNAEVYVVDVASGALTRVTNNYAIDTEATWLPDGRGLIFTSDRGGRPQLYRAEVGRGGVVGRPARLTFEGDYNARATISPDGKRVAMVHGDKGRFRIAVLELETETLRVLTETRLDESPSFAPNGSMIIYATEVNGRGVLEAVSVDGRAHQRLGLQQGDVREPAWSPYYSK